MSLILPTYNLTTLEQRLIQHEGFKHFGYSDSLGNFTIGCGRNIDSRGGLGLSSDEIIYLLRNDINRTEGRLLEYGWYRHLDSRVRQEAIIEMAFNLGMTKFLNFRKAIRAISLGNYDEAARELIDSTWAEQLPERAQDIANRVRHGTL